MHPLALSALLASGGGGAVNDGPIAKATKDFSN